MILPPRLEPGDTVALVSPSWGGAGLFPHRVERGLQCLHDLGFKTQVAPHALHHHGFVSDTAANRVDDLHRMFLDPAVKAIVSAIGGNHSCHLLPLLDFDLIAANPTILVGFSDVTVLNVAVWQQTGLVTFNGPALLTDFAEYPSIFAYTSSHMLRTFCEAEAVGPIEPSTWWTEEVLRWETKADLERPRVRKPSPGWTWLKPGSAEGVLIGGCIESLEHLRGTRFWPDWRDAILFFETSEDAPSPSTVDAMLMDYENMGVLQQLNGMIVARPMRYSDEDKQMLREVIMARTRQFEFPIITDMDFGHTSPQFTLPIGCRARIDSEDRRFEIVEAAVC